MKRKQDQLEVALNEKTLAFEEIKRHLLKAARCVKKLNFLLI
jgi:hypothetical protein